MNILDLFSSKDRLINEIEEEKAYLLVVLKYRLNNNLPYSEVSRKINTLNERLTMAIEMPN